MRSSCLVGPQPRLSQDLEFPRALIFVIQAIGSIEVELPGGRGVFVVQAIHRAEAHACPAVALAREGSRGLAQVAAHGWGGQGAQRGTRCGELRVHGRQVGAAVKATEVGSRAGVGLGVTRRLGVGHGEGGRPLHAGGGGRGQGVWQRRDRGRAPDGDGGAGAGAGGHRGAGGQRAVLPIGAGFGTGLRGWRAFFLGWPSFGLSAALLLLLATFGPAVLEPDLEERREQGVHGGTEKKGQCFPLGGGGI